MPREYSEKSYPLKDLTEKIIKAAFTVHNRLGPSFLEKVYENALTKELQGMGIKAEQQKQMRVNYGGEPIGDFFVDMLVEDKVIVELKAVTTLEKSFEEKLLHYLKVSGVEVGLLINFGKSVQVKRKIYTQRQSA
jgi:GxxExxY protein